MDNSTSKQESTSSENSENNKAFGDMSKNTKRYERKALEGTPFVIHESETHGWAAGIAEHRITGWYKTEEDLKRILKGTDSKKGINWDLLASVIIVLIDKTNEVNKLNAQIENNNK